MTIGTPELALGQKLPSNSQYFYRVIQPLGTGGNAHVYLVEALQGPNRGILFALKLFTKIADATRLGRFSEEVEFLKACQHPAIMRVYDGGEVLVSGTGQPARFPFVIAEYLPRTLHDAMRRGLTMIERLSFVLQLLSATSLLSNHERRVVHRDIKPENIFVRANSCILGDFGLLKFLLPVSQAEDGDKDREFFVESTGPRLPRFYRTPDLIAYCKDKGELTPKSDVFQLGLVFAEMFTGTNPLREPKGIYDDLILDSIAEPKGSQGAAIRSLLDSMLIRDPTSRPSADDLLDRWEGIFLEAVKISHQLEGRIF